MTTRSYPDARAELGEQFEKWGSFILANLLWAVLSIPLVTMPAATAGLFAVMSARARGKQPDLFPTFLGGMKRLWLKATLLMGINLAAGALVAVNLIVLPQIGGRDPIAYLSGSATLFGGLALLLVNLYAWPLLGLTDVPFKRLLTYAAAMAFAHPLWSLGVLLLTILPVAVSLLLPQGIFLIATASACALIACAGTWRVIRRRLPETDFA